MIELNNEGRSRDVAGDKVVAGFSDKGSEVVGMSSRIELRMLGTSLVGTGKTEGSKLDVSSGIIELNMDGRSTLVSGEESTLVGIPSEDKAVVGRSSRIELRTLGTSCVGMGKLDSSRLDGNAVIMELNIEERSSPVGREDAPLGKDGSTVVGRSFKRELRIEGTSSVGIGRSEGRRLVGI